MITEKYHIKKDDKVRIIAGKDKGKIGKVLKTNRKNNRIVVENINIIKRHVRPGGQHRQGGIISVENAAKSLIRDPKVYDLVKSRGWKHPAASCSESSTVRNSVYFLIRSLTPQQAAGNAFAVQYNYRWLSKKVHITTPSRLDAGGI